MARDGRGGGPWGGGGRDPGDRGDRHTPPDLSDLIQKGQDQLRDIFSTGRGGGDNGSGRGRGGSGYSNKFVGFFVVFVVGALWLMQCFYTVAPEEEGVVLRFGEYSRTNQPGLHFIFWPIETVETPKTQEENQITFGFGSSAGATNNLMLAGDQNVVDIGFTVLWKIRDAQEYLFNIRGQETLIRAVSESAMREVVGRTSAEVIRTRGREEAQNEVRALIQETLDSYFAGIQITAVKLEAADPPPAVIDAFEEVQRAEQNQNKFIREAEQYRNRLLGEARGEAAKIEQEAEAYKARVVNEAEGEADRFISVYGEYVKARDVTRKRLFLETLEDVFSNSNKILVEPGSGPGVIPYLALPEIDKSRTPLRSSNSGGSSE